MNLNLNKKNEPQQKNEQQEQQQSNIIDLETESSSGRKRKASEMESHSQPHSQPKMTERQKKLQQQQEKQQQNQLPITAYTKRYSTRHTESRQVQIDGVNSNDTLQTLKLKIFEVTESVFPLHQVLYYKDFPIVLPDTSTVSDAGIPANSLIIVEENTQNKSTIEEEPINREVESGFAGTALQSSSNSVVSQNKDHQNKDQNGNNSNKNSNNSIDLNETQEDEMENHKQKKQQSASKQWSCEACTLMNPMSSDKCEACRAERTKE